MSKYTAVPALSALAHEGRLSVFRLLARRAPDLVSAGELYESLDLKPSTLSVYVSVLMQAGLLRQVRDGRFLRYGLNMDAASGLIDFLVNDCGRGRPEFIRSIPHTSDFEHRSGPLNVLFVCTGNSARSIFAEAILTANSNGRFKAFSGGTKPYMSLNPQAESLLRAKGHDTTKLHPKLLNEFYEVSAPKMDFVFTVCDQAANEECPPLFGQPISAHWGMPDPVKAEGGEAEQALAFQRAYGMLKQRIEAFVSLPLASVSRMSLQHKLDEIGQSEPA